MTDTQYLKRVTIFLATLTALLTYATLADAALEIKENAFEVQLEQIQRWPLGEGDSLVVRPCRGCETQTLQVTGATRYAAGLDNAQILTLPEALRMKAKMRNDPTHIILVFYRPDDHPDAGQVTRLILLTDF